MLPSLHRRRPARAALHGRVSGQPGFGWAWCERCGWHRFNDDGEPQCSTGGQPAAVSATGRLFCPACAERAARALQMARQALALSVQLDQATRNANDHSDGPGGDQ